MGGWSLLDTLPGSCLWDLLLCSVAPSSSRLTCRFPSDLDILSLKNIPAGLNMFKYLFYRVSLSQLCLGAGRDKS